MSGFLIKETIIRANNAKTFVSTFAVFPTAQSQVKNYKKAKKSSHLDKPLDRLSKTEKKGRRHNRRSCCTTCPVNTGTTPKNRNQKFLTKK
jgi:hypothetical protein